MFKALASGIITGVVLCCALAVGCREPGVTASSARHMNDARTVYAVGHGWHVGIVVQRAHIVDPLWPEQQDFPEAEYLEVGWGDADFYRAPEATVGLMLRAAFASKGSVLSVIALPVPPLEYYRRSEVIALTLSAEEFKTLAQYIQASYSRDTQGQAMWLGPGPYGHSAFYRAEGQYSLNNTCNTWAASALQAAGLDITPTAQAGPLMRQLRQVGQVLRR